MATSLMRFNLAGMMMSMLVMILMICGTSSGAMNPPSDHDIFFKYYFIAKTDGKIEKLLPPNHVPASLDMATNVQSTDVLINHKTKVVARLYRPMKAPSGTRLPVLVYFHAGGFAISSALDKDVHAYMNKLSSSGNVVVLSVDYRLFPDTSIADIYKDGFDAVKWLSESAGGKTSGSSADLGWMKDVVDFDRIFVGGHDSGGNMAHNVGMKFQKAKPKGVKLAGIIPIQSYFLTEQPLPSLIRQDKDMQNNITQYWPFIVPGSGPEDRRVNPSLEPNLKILKPAKVLVCVAELDGLTDANKAYYDALQKSGVESEYFVSKGRKHNFDNFATDSNEASALQSKIFSFMA